MRIAFSKHALLAGLLTASLSALVTVTAPPVGAFADTGGEAASTPTASAPTATASTETAPTTGATPAVATAPTGGSTSGGAAPTAGTPGRPTIATWFGPGFYGHATACGQTLTPKLVGVASRTLPCGTLVQIGYRGHQLTVPVLDRGPYGHNGATWDLTWGAARALKIKETVRIVTQIVGSVPNTPTLGEPALTVSPLAPDTTSGSLATVSPSATAAQATGGAAAG
jgi:rare lipoprotein A (peptidoglycan hydrolase)